MSAATTWRVDWQGIPLSVTHTPDRWGQVDHIEVQTVDRSPLPITATGYKSIWLCPEDMAGYATSPWPRSWASRLTDEAVRESGGYLLAA